MFKQTAFLFLILMLLSFQSLLEGHDQDQSHEVIQVGVIFDMNSLVGKFIYRCIKMAISDFYKINPHYITRIVLNIRDTKGEPLRALSAALDLLEAPEVQAIIGPDSTVEIRFLDVLEQKVHIPILSLSTSPFSNHNPYLRQIAQDETDQFKGIAAMVESFKHEHIIVICEDTSNGREMATYIVHELQEKRIHVTVTSLVSTFATNRQIREELHKLQNMQTMTFVVHTSPSLSSNLFSMAKEVGMMSEGYMWIVSSKTANFLNFMDAKTIDSMQGVVGFKSCFPRLSGLHNLDPKWRKIYNDLNPFMDFKEVDCNGVWAYDAVFALAMAVEKVQPTFTGASLLNQISRIAFRGLGGEFKFTNGRIVAKPVEVVNVVGKRDRTVGFWMVNGEFVKEIRKTYSSLNNGLETIVFPGGITTVPARRRLEINGKKLRLLVPDFGGNSNIVHMALDPVTNLPNISGLCGDIFHAAFNALNYGVDIEFTQYPYEDGRTYNDLIDKIYYKEFDASIGDITITSNRTRYVDFTLPFSDLGVGTLARNAKKSMWIFFDPLSADLWVTSVTFFLFLGFFIWFNEHRTNEEFQGSRIQQIGTSLWFAFSTLVYAHREKLQSNLSKFVVTIWVFVVLVLTSSYTATLSSLLTVQQIASKGKSVQFQGLSPVGGAVYNKLQFNNSIIERLDTYADYARVLRSGRVGAIIDEILYVKSALALYPPPEFSLVATASNTNGFAFIFQKGSPLITEISTQIAKLREDGTLKALEDKWLNRTSSTMSNDFSAPPNILYLYGLRGLFLISGVSMGFALLMSMVCIVREKLH